MAVRVLKSEQTPHQALPSTIWQGGFFSAHSLARVNRELVSALLRTDPQWQLLLLPVEGGDPIEEAESHPLQGYHLQGAPLNPHGWQLVVRHQFPPDWSEVEVPLILIQPWEFGSAPRAWVEQIVNRDWMLWVPSTFVYQTFVESGVPAEKVRHVPNGVNTTQFHPQSSPLHLTSLGMTNVPRSSLNSRYKFLYVGGSIARKGIDVLLKAYRKAFHPQDEVLLVVKDFGTRDFYSDQNWRSMLEEWAQDSTAPPLLYLPDTMPEREMPRLYTACDCLVHPYRGEGFGLPIVEAMACGLPVIVTNFGACLDFCDEENAYLLPAKKRDIPGDLGELETVHTPFWAEPSEEALVETLRFVYEHREEAAQKGKAARLHMEKRFTWDHAAAIAASALREVGQRSEKPIHYDDLARARLKNGDPNAALSLFAKAVELTPDNPRIYEGAIIATLQQNRWEAAEALLNKALGMFPQDMGLIAQRAWIKFYSQREPEAYEDVVRLLRKGYAEPEWLRQVVLPLHDYLLCQQPKPREWEHGRVGGRERRRAKDKTTGRRDEKTKNEKRKTRNQKPKTNKISERIQFLEEHLHRHGIAIPDEPVGTRITLCMIARNEANFLPDCLESVRGAVDEIILVDTGSTDETPEIAHRYGAQVVTHPWNDDFSEARNVGLAHATGDWILWLDADERLSPGTQAMVREAVRHPQFAAYYLEILNVLDESDPDAVFIHRAVRLFRRLSCAKWEGRVHEQVLPALQVHGYKVANLQNAQIRHLGYERKVMEGRGKSQRNVRILEKTLEENPEDSFHLFNLANTYFDQGEYEQALPYLERACMRIEAQQDFAPVAWSQWITCLYNLGKPEKAREVARTAVARGIRDPLVWFAYAEACTLTGDYEQAIEALEGARQRAIAMGLLSQDGTTLLGSSGFVGDPHVVTYKWHYTMARACFGLQRVEEARQHAESALALNPNYHEAHYLLAELLRLAGQPEKADHHYQQAIRSHRVAPLALNDAANMWWDLGRLDRALPYFARLAELQPQEETWWHRWMHCAEQTNNRRAICEASEFLVRHGKPLNANICVNWGRACWEQGHYEEALHHFAQAVEIDPHNANVLFNTGDALYRLGAYSEAADLYSAALENDPYNPEGWFVLGNCYFRMGVYDAARIAYSQTLKLNPRHEPARQNLEFTEEMIRSVAA